MASLHRTLRPLPSDLRPLNDLFEKIDREAVFVLHPKDICEFVRDLERRLRLRVDFLGDSAGVDGDLRATNVASSLAEEELRRLPSLLDGLVGGGDGVKIVEGNRVEEGGSDGFDLLDVVEAGQRGGRVSGEKTSESEKTQTKEDVREDLAKSSERTLVS
jgi:hypothetical protein